MNFRIADTFTASLVKLTGEEQKAIKTTSFDLQLNPANPGMQFHKLDRAKDSNFWSVRVNRDIRIIVHRIKNSLLLCYAGHHDDAYNWAESRKLEIHPITGAVQLVEIREKVQEITIPCYVSEQKVVHPVLAHVSEYDLLEYGVPDEWIEEIKSADEDRLLEIAEHLPGEAAEAVLNLATGSEAVKPVKTLPEPETGDPFAPIPDPFAHPDSLRRFRTIENVEELERALEFPWEKWSVFLHPDQKNLVERDYNGPARISGTAGTGKTVVALHRAVYLAKSNLQSRILLTTFSTALASNLKNRIKALLSNEPRVAERTEIYSLDSICSRLYELKFGKFRIIGRDGVREIIESIAAQNPDHKFTKQFLISEWEQIVDAWQLKSWEEYRDVVRLGRKTRLPEKQRSILWAIYDDVKTRLEERGYITQSEMYDKLAKQYEESEQSPFDFIIVDESQDISALQLKFLAALNSDEPNGLFFTGDLGQRIFQQPFSWKSQGVNIQGRSHTLLINYRTSHQIREQADLLLGAEITDVDGITEDRRNAISVFSGPEPEVKLFDDIDSEIESVGLSLTQTVSEGVKPHEIGLFVRSSEQLDRARKAVLNAGLSENILDENIDIKKDCLSVCTMHLAKGLEFKAVIVMACDDDVIPSLDRIKAVTDESDLEEIYNTERHLLYVACTRAREYLLVTGVSPGSEFLDDFKSNSLDRGKRF